MRLCALPAVLLALLASSAAAQTGKKDDPVGPLVKKLLGKDPAERIEAARSLGKLGKAAVAASRVLCEVASASDGEQRAESLEALEKIAPGFHALVVTLLVDSDTTKRENAARLLATAGATAGVPAILAGLNRTESTELQLPMAAALVDLEPGHPGVLAAVQRLAKPIEADPSAFVLLADLGSRHQPSRKTVAASLVAVLRRVKRADYLAVAIKAACLLPADAKKDALPVLRKLKLHDDEAIRREATGAFEQLSGDVLGGAAAGPKAAAGELEGGGASRSYDVKFRGGGMAMVWAAGDGRSMIEVHVFAPDGTEVAGSPVAGCVLWRPAREGAYRIQVQNTGEAGRFRIKHN